VLAAVLIAGSRLVSPDANVNFAHADPFFQRSWGPAPVHLAVIWAPLVFLLYWPMHRVLRRVMPRPLGPSPRGR
jgi:hypothetical protein